MKSTSSVYLVFYLPSSQIGAQDDHCNCIPDLSSNFWQWSLVRSYSEVILFALVTTDLL